MPGRVAVSVGHYPEEDTREIEYPANEKVARILYDMLIVNAFSAELIPGGRLPDKVKAVNHFRPDIAIEVHFNRLEWPHNPTRFGDGYEVCVWKGSKSGKFLGGAVLEEFKHKLPFRRRGTGIWERNDLYFLKHTVCPALIIEPLFLDNPTEVPFLQMKYGYEFIAEAVFIGVVRYFKQVLPLPVA